MNRLAIVGSGPMSLYTLKHLMSRREVLEVDVYEADDVAGVGMPYRPGLNSDEMLCNAFSREIPHASRPLIQWLESLPARKLSSWELSWHDLSPRAFYPRVLIGEYLRSEFEAAVKALGAAGHQVRVLTGHRVTDVVPGPQDLWVSYRAGHDEGSSRYDHVVIASGHAWPEEPELAGVRLVSPWPYTNVTALPPGRIGVLGSSLSAIDVLVALATEHGTFDETDDLVTWTPTAGHESLSIHMVSHRGIMPEGDFYYHFPYAPLVHITEDAVQREVDEGEGDLLERVFALLLRELDHAEPTYLEELGPKARTVEGFAEAYFARRQRLGGLAAVRRGLAQTRRSLQERRTIPHRYALLRGHESFDRALRHLSEADYQAFEDHLLPVFADCYAAVPHLSLARVLALHDAGVLELRATGHDSTFHQLEDGSVVADTLDGPLHLDHLVDARGQAPRSLCALPFPSLAAAMGDDPGPLTEPFLLSLPGPGRVYCLALPQLLERLPFSQGLPNCHELAEVVVGDLLGHPERTMERAPDVGRVA